MATTDLTSEILEELNSLPTSTQGNGQNFIFLLKKLLGNLKTELEDKFTEISNIANSITDAPETIAQQLKDCRVRVVAGTGVGYEGTISGNTIGANAVLNVTPASAVAFDATTQYQVFSGSLWFMNAGTAAVGFST